MYPRQLIPNGDIEFEINGELIRIPKCTIFFEKWHGQPIDNFGGKPLVCVGKKPMFAELAILQGFISDGWEGRWIETYGKNKSSPIFLAEWKDNSYKYQHHSDIINEEIKNTLDTISIYNSKSYAGCWDVFGWKDGRVLFAESKRRKKDRIQSTQLNWLAAAFKYGLKPDNFLMVEWDFADEILTVPASQVFEKPLKTRTILKKSTENTEWAFFQELFTQTGMQESETAQKVLNWINPIVKNNIKCGSGGAFSLFPVLKYKNEKIYSFGIWPNGDIEIYFQYMKKQSPFNSEEKRIELLNRLNLIKGVSLSKERIAGRPRFPIARLTDKSELQKFFNAFDWYWREIQGTITSL